MALEVSGFVLGLSAIIPIVQTSFQAWQSLADSKSFGTDLIEITVKLSVEYYRFLTWARISQALERPAVETPQVRIPDLLSARLGPSSPMNLTSSSPVEAPILDVAARIVSIIEEVSRIASKYAVDDSATTPRFSHTKDSEPPKSISRGLSTVLPILGAPHPAIPAVMLQHRQSSITLQKRNSLRLRLSFGTKPWGQPDKKILEEKIIELRHLNDWLESFLPPALGKTVQLQAVPGQILLEDNKGILQDLIMASEHKNVAVRTHARLWAERIKFQDGLTNSNSRLNDYRHSSTVITPVTGLSQSRCELSLALFRVGVNAPQVTAIEWYPYQNLNWSVNDLDIASKRLAEFANLSSFEDCPQSLQILRGTCFIDDGQSLGYVCQLPTGASVRKQPVSLHSLLQRDAECSGFRPPALGQRLLLAQTLAGSVYSFSLVRWFHKDLNCRNVVFFRDSSPTAAIILEAPSITGFSISRPDSENQKSLDKERDRQAIYLHPDLRVDYPREQRPKYSRKYEIYALGLLLFEIGIWRPIDKHMTDKISLSARDFKKAMIDRCTKDLPFYTGDQYRDVVLSCLTCGDEDSDESAASLDGIYWSIVLELAKCR